jgi:LysM domain-containing protein
MGQSVRALTTEHVFATVPEHMFVSTSTRRMITALAALLCASAFLLGEAIPSRGASPPRHHRVHQGETLWGIAERAYPGADPREAVYRIRIANHIPGSQIAAGQKLVLP